MIQETKGERSIHSEWHPKGFALIATISVMVLLVMVALAMLTLSSIEIRQSSHTGYQQEARANARMALMIAVGELQKYAGPDQRVTATAGILDSDPKSASIDGVEHPNWVGIWRTDGLKNEAIDTPLIVADPKSDEQALRDRRQDAGYDRQTEALAWLVSGQNPDPTRSSSTGDMVRLYEVDQLPSGGNARDYNVYAEKVNVIDSGGSGRSNQIKGHYAYWVSDEGTKAKLNIRDNYAGKSPNKNDPGNGGYYKILTAQRNDFEQIFDSYEQMSPEEVYKMMTGSQATLADLGNAQGFGSKKEAVKALRHDITTYSSSLLVDVARGGLKKDLTAYLESAGSVPGLGTMLGISDDQPLITSIQHRDTIGPKYGSLRSWYQLKDKTSGNFASRSIKMQTPNVMSGVAMSSQGGVDGAHFTKQPIHPVLKEAVYYVNHAYDSNPASRRVYEFIYPRVVLWNPYNVTLEASEMYVLIDMRLQLAVIYKWRASNGAREEKRFDTSLVWGGRNENTRCFTIPATSFKPGEALVFTTRPSGAMLRNKAVRYNDPRQNVSSNMLTATEDPSDLYCFYKLKGTLPSTANMNTVKIQYGGIFWNGNQPTQSVYLFGRNGGGVANINNLGTSQFPTLQQMHLDNYSRGNNGRWLPTYNPYNTYSLDQVLGGGVSPDTLNAYGVRFRHFYESHSNRANGAALNEPWYAAPIVHSNVRAGIIHRWSRDNFFGMRYSRANVDANYSGPAAHLYTYGPLAQCRQWSEWQDSEVNPHFENGRYRTAVFSDASFGGSSHVYPLFDIPNKDIPLFSLASLQHVQLTPYIWHPTYAIGSSLAPPYDDLGVTAQSWKAERAEWRDKLNQLLPGTNEFVHQLGRSNENTLVYDLAYEANHAIWDRYFFSSLPHDKSHAGWNSSEWDLDIPLPNSRYHIVPTESNGGSYDQLTDFHRSAKGLVVDGALNVNSTSVVAWESFLRAFNEVETPVRSGSAGTTDGHAYSRFILPETGEAIPTDVSDPGLWSGFRRLSDDDIHRLAVEIVVDVKKRGPFISLADFVNRRLLTIGSGKYPEIAYAGALQSAINRSGLNDALQSNPQSEFTLPTPAKAASYEYGANYWGGPIRQPEPQQYDTFEYESTGSGSKLTLSEAAGASGYLMQGDILQKVGAALSARSDTFVIRTYGDSVNSRGKIMARAWCEAVVQRTVEPINPDPNSSGLNPLKTNQGDFGRRFKLVSFRWLAADDV